MLYNTLVTVVARLCVVLRMGLLHYSRDCSVTNSFLVTRLDFLRPFAHVSASCFHCRNAIWSNKANKRGRAFNQNRRALTWSKFNGRMIFIQHLATAFACIHFSSVTIRAASKLAPERNPMKYTKNYTQSTLTGTSVYGKIFGSRTHPGRPHSDL